MAYYLQRERYQNNEIASGSLMTFDQECALSRTDGEADFIYYEDGSWEGSIEVINRGHYLIMWGLTQIAGRPVTDDLFQLKRWVDDPINPSWVPIAGVSTHLHTAAATGFAILEHTQSTPVRVGLFQVSSEEVSLSNLGETTKEGQKARILFYGLSENDGDFSIIYERIKHLEEECCLDLDELMKRITRLQEGNVEQDLRLDELETSFEAYNNEFEAMIIPPSPYITVNAYSSFPGIQIKVQRVGYIYYFWCDATLTSDVNLSAANTSTYFLRSQDFVMEGINPFDYFAETVPLHFHLVWNTATSTTATTTEGYFNLRVDNTGIYVRKTSSTALYARSNRTITFHFAIPLLVPIVP